MGTTSTPFSTPPSQSGNELGHSSTSGLHGTLQTFDDGHTLIEATEELKASRQDGLDASLTASCRREHRENSTNVIQANYSYSGRALPDVTLETGVAAFSDPPAGFRATAIREVTASQFGKNDHEDEGTGSPTMGLIQTNSEVFGASVKVSIMKTLFGEHWQHNDSRLGALAEILDEKSKRFARVPLVDIGPGETIRAEVDLTWASDQFLGTGGQATIKYRILLPE